MNWTKAINVTINNGDTNIALSGNFSAVAEGDALLVIASGSPYFQQLKVGGNNTIEFAEGWLYGNVTGATVFHVPTNFELAQLEIFVSSLANEYSNFLNNLKPLLDGTTATVQVQNGVDAEGNPTYTNKTPYQYVIDQLIGTSPVFSGLTLSSGNFTQTSGTHSITVSQFDVVTGLDGVMFARNYNAVSSAENRLNLGALNGSNPTASARITTVANFSGAGTGTLTLDVLNAGNMETALSFASSKQATFAADVTGPKYYSNSDGSAGSPAFRKTGTGSGMYFSGNDVRISAASVDIAEFKATGVDLSGKVRIDSSGGSGEDLTIVNANANYEIISLGTKLTGDSGTALSRLVNTRSGDGNSSLEFQVSNGGSPSTAVTISQNKNVTFKNDSNSYNSADAAIKAGSASVTGRTLNADGTINASGADYAEYVRIANWILLHNESIENNRDLTDEEKNEQYIKIKAGDVIGFDADGRVTTKFSEAVSGFAVKSTKPNMVGGDAWAATPKPELIKPNSIEYAGTQEPTKPNEPTEVQQPVEVLKPVEVLEPVPAEYNTAEEYADAKAEYQNYVKELQVYNNYVDALDSHNNYLISLSDYNAALDQYNTNLSQYVADQVAHAHAVAHEKARVDALNVSNYNDWFAIHEQERATVDRIAFCGVVPVNTRANFAHGDYLIPVQGVDDSIEVVSRKPDNITFTDSLNRIGRVKETEPETARPIIIVNVG